MPSVCARICLVLLQLLCNASYPAVAADAPRHDAHSCDAFDISLLQNEVDVSKYDDDDDDDDAPLTDEPASALVHPQPESLGPVHPPHSDVSGLLEDARTAMFHKHFGRAQRLARQKDPMGPVWAAKEEMLDPDWANPRVMDEYVAQIDGHGSLPPACVRDAPADAPYWTEEKRVLQLHCECEFGLCNKFIQNGERVELLRGALSSTRSALRDAGASGEWIIDAGTAIGALRCEDVLPWDDDCDVAVTDTGLASLFSRYFNTTDTGYVKGRSYDLDDRYVLRSKDECIPFAVVDKTTGFYCDVMSLQSNRVSLVDSARKLEYPAPKLQMAFNEGPVKLGRVELDTENSKPSFFHPDADKNCNNGMGYIWNYADVFPSKDCKLGEEVFPCARDMESYLNIEYSGSFAEPDTKTALVENRVND